MIVTFCGQRSTCRCFSDVLGLLKFDQIHVDLYPTLSALAITEVLRRSKSNWGSSEARRRRGSTDTMRSSYGRRHLQLGDERALAKLVAYNREDVVNLERLAEYATPSCGSALSPTLSPHLSKLKPRLFW